MQDALHDMHIWDICECLYDILGLTFPGSAIFKRKTLSYSSKISIRFLIWCISLNRLIALSDEMFLWRARTNIILVLLEIVHNYSFIFSIKFNLMLHYFWLNVHEHYHYNNNYFSLKTIYKHEHKKDNLMVY